jgi:hypothetical protein
MLMEFKPPPPSDWVEYKTPGKEKIFFDTVGVESMNTIHFDF